jgi:predicted transcriptional regulator
MEIYNKYLNIMDEIIKKIKDEVWEANYELLNYMVDNPTLSCIKTLREAQKKINSAIQDLKSLL